MKTPLEYTPVLLPAQMRAQPVYHAIHGWLKDMTFDQVVELWWMAQAERATEAERDASRSANPDDMYGKSVEYVQQYYRK